MEINKINSNSFKGVYVNKACMTNLQKCRADIFADVLPYVADIPEGIDVLVSRSKGKKNRMMVQFLEDGNYIRSVNTGKPISISSSFLKMDVSKTRNAFIDRVKEVFVRLANSKTYSNCSETGKTEVNIAKIMELENNCRPESYGLLENLLKRSQYGLPIKLKK